MSRYLFVTWAGGGNVNPVLGLAAALRAGGHDVAAVTAGGNAGRLEAAGIEVVAAAGGWLPRAGDVLGALGRYAPDAVVVDYMVTDALAAGDRFGCPAIALVHTLYLQLLADGAPSPMAMAGSVDDVNVTRSTLGLAPVAHLAELLGACDLVLVTVPRALDADGAVPAGVVYVGPLFESPGPDGAWRPPPGDGPLVVVSAGTAGDPDAEVDLLRRVAAALAVLPVRGFVTLPDYVDSGRIEWPANVTWSGYVRHSAVLPHAEVLVTHAGLGSVTAALAHGVPMVCLPLGREQPDNAAAVARLGAGGALPADADGDTADLSSGGVPGVGRSVRSAAMNPTYGPEAEAYRDKVQAFLAEKLPSDWEGIGRLEGDAIGEFVEWWRGVLYESGYLAPGWPVEYGGGGLSALEQVIIAEEFARAGVPTGGPNDVFGIQMLGNTLLVWGTEEQKRHYLPRILSGEDRWCQGYSEPNAGSDLGSLALRAGLDGDQWVLNGQKIWTSAGHLADHIFTLARTDPDAPKHKGISFLLVDMRQPGIEVRPIKMISGESEFNEVFYTDAVCPKEHVVGGVNNGWAVAMSLLGYERGEAAATLSIRYQAELDRLLRLARERGVDQDPLVRQRLAWCYGKVQVMRYLGMRTLTRFLAGHHPGPDGAITKLYWSEYHRVVTELAVDLLGAEALSPSGRPPSSAFQTDDAGAPNSSASWVNTFLNARAGTIYAGSSQIQRNIIGEMVLGLPKEPKAPG